MGAQAKDVHADLRQMCKGATQDQAQRLKREKGKKGKEISAIVALRERDREVRACLKRVLRVLGQAASIENGEESEEETDPELEEEVVGAGLKRATIPLEPFPRSPFASTRRQLNLALAGMVSRKTTDKRSREDSTVPCRSVKWSRVADVYDRRVKKDDGVIPVEVISREDIKPVLAELRRQQKWFSETNKSDADVRRTLSISAIMCGAADIVNDTSIQFVQEAPLRNSSLLSAGKADLLATRNELRKVVVVQVTNENAKQGIAHALMKMEIAIAENEREGIQATPLFGIVSNFVEWRFYRYDATGIKYTSDVINQTHSLDEDVRRIVGRICSMLRE
jgi:hypothetical protein